MQRLQVIVRAACFARLPAVFAAFFFFAKRSFKEGCLLNFRDKV